MSYSEQLPSPDNDYAAPGDPYLNRAFWDAALTSVGARIRALEAVKAGWEELIAAGTGQALAVIQANVEPQLVALTAIINQLKADVAVAEDAIAIITAGGVTMANVVGLNAALALKASTSYVDEAIDALKGGAPSAYDTLVEIAAQLGNDGTAIAGLLATVATKAAKTTKVKVGAGFVIDGVAGSDEAPAEGDLSTDRLIKLSFATGAMVIAGEDDEYPVNSSGVHAAIVAALASASGVPIGTWDHFGGQTPPAGYLVRDGSAVSRTVYAALFAVCGTIYGAGDGSTTFNLPDGRGVFDRGWDGGRGLDSGRVFGSYQVDMLSSHSHTTQVSGSSGTPAVLGVQTNSGSNYGTITTASTGGTETRPKNIAGLPIIRAY